MQGTFVATAYGTMSSAICHGFQVKNKGRRASVSQ
jgi:hypothetical protein